MLALITFRIIHKFPKFQNKTVMVLALNMKVIIPYHAVEVMFILMVLLLALIVALSGATHT